MLDFINNKKAFGLEISDFSLKAFWLKKKGNNYEIASHNRLRLPKGLVVEGEIKKEDEVALLVQELLGSAKSQKIIAPYVVSSLPENKTFVRIIKVPQMSKKDLEEAIKWEAENHIPISIDDAYIDWQILNKDGKDIELLLSSTPRSLIDSYINVFNKAKLKVEVLEPCAASKGRALINEIKHKGSKKAYLIVDIGASKTVFDVVSNDKIYFSSSVFTVSGNLFTKTIADTLGIKESEAEKIKIECCSPKISEKERKILDSIHSVVDNLALEIRKIETYFYQDLKNKNIDFEILICGGGASFFGIVPYLSLKVKQKVKLGNPWVNIKLDKPLELNHSDSLTYTEVIGLAIRGANLKTYQTK
ncbi:MAG: type IV pilus assembly protein PilM [Parcubacteria group bacterium]|nr:type IV pilus assembly protein PilM [Parcubacteria group bacterium]